MRAARKNGFRPDEMSKYCFPKRQKQFVFDVRKWTSEPPQVLIIMYEGVIKHSALETNRCTTVTVFGGAPQGWPVCACVRVSVRNKKHFRFSAPTPFRDLRFKTWRRKLCPATLTLSRALEMASRGPASGCIWISRSRLGQSKIVVKTPSLTHLLSLTG